MSHTDLVSESLTSHGDAFAAKAASADWLGGATTRALHVVRVTMLREV